MFYPSFLEKLFCIFFKNFRFFLQISEWNQRVIEDSDNIRGIVIRVKQEPDLYFIIANFRKLTKQELSITGYLKNISIVFRP